MENKTAFIRSTGNFVRAAFKNLTIGAKATLLFPIQLDALRTSWLQIAAALVLSVLPPLLYQLLSVGLGGEFGSYGLQGIWYPFAIIFIFAVVAAKLLGIEEKIKQLVLLLLNANIAIGTIIYTLSLALKISVGYLPDGLGGYWLGLILASALIKSHPNLNRKVRAIGIAAGIAVAFSINGVWQMDTLWSKPYDEQQTQREYENYYAPVAEEILYLQPKILTEHLNRLKRGPQGTNMYFVGVAGYAEQKVFVREIRSVQQLFLSRYTAKERSMLLVNNAETLRTEPIASTTALTATVARIAEVMDKENDILFIYMTSHGSKEHGLNLHFSPLRLNDLEPKTLRKMLDDAGIQWRVVVISACYSGGFIEPLTDAKTLVITAAAADRTSFGCSDENDFTYFGKAYFGEALAKTSSFIDAFELAKAAVAVRERAENQKASNPQISIGSDIRAKLETFQSTISAKQAPR